MNVILLCAGFGTRLYPLTKDRPKPLLPVAGKPIIEFLVDQLASTGRMSDCLIVTNRRFAEPFKAWRDTIAKRLPTLRFSILDDGATDNENRMGAIRDLALAVKTCQVSNPTLGSAGDNLLDFDVGEFLDDYAKRPRNLILTYRETDVDSCRRTGIAELGDEGRLLRLHEKPSEPPTNLACPAFYLLQSKTLGLLERFLRESPEADAPGHFVAWLASRQRIFTYEMHGRRFNVGNLENYRRAEQWVKAAGPGFLTGGFGSG